MKMTNTLFDKIKSHTSAALSLMTVTCLSLSALSLGACGNEAQPVSAQPAAVLNTQESASAVSAASSQSSTPAAEPSTSTASTAESSIAASSSASAPSQEPVPATEPSSAAVTQEDNKNAEVVSQAAENYASIDADPEKIKSDIIDQFHAWADYVDTSAGYPDDQYPPEQYIAVQRYNSYLIGLLFGIDHGVGNAYEGVFTLDEQVNRMRYAFFNRIPYSLATCTIEYKEVLSDWFKGDGPEFKAINSIVLSSPALEGRSAKTFDGIPADLEADIVGVEVGGDILNCHVYLSSERTSDGSVSRYRVLDCKTN
ncbi:putative uncharacterized protein [Bacteroides pectinophilus CAG:437]|uniref:Uncharacterized protein n=1 Tax=Bacteroides pectinophilus CAG:437 TaxID=1263051 RepID=R7B3N4_9FIRM|nr:putative uncharacterized protein [Bacteroides pectinophilus CAG:437]